MYSEADTFDVRVLDLGTGADQLIDSGEFGSVSIAPDRAHVAYAGTGGLVKVADRAGSITPLPSGGCSGPGIWHSDSVLTYCVSTGTMLLPALDAVPRLLESRGFAVFADGETVTYVDQSGDLVLEHRSGSDHRILWSSPVPTSPAVYLAGLSADQEVALVADSGAFPPRLHIVSISDGSSIIVEDAFLLRTPFGTPTFLGASSFAADHSELLLQSTTSLIAVTLATGARRTISMFGDRVSGGGAAFLPDGRVLWVRVDDQSDGDIGRFSLSLRIAGPSADDDRILVGPTPPYSAAWPTIAVSPEGFIAVPADVLLVTLDGGVILRNGSPSDGPLAHDILALLPDGRGVITTGRQGEIRHIAPDGTDHLLVRTGVAPDLLGPVAAYAPTPAP